MNNQQKESTLYNKKKKSKENHNWLAQQHLYCVKSMIMLKVYSFVFLTFFFFYKKKSPQKCITAFAPSYRVTVTD